MKQALGGRARGPLWVPCTTQLSSQRVALNHHTAGKPRCRLLQTKGSTPELPWSALGWGRVHATCCGQVEPTQGAPGKSHWSNLGAPRGLCLWRAGVQEAVGWPWQPEMG